MHFTILLFQIVCIGLFSVSIFNKFTSSKTMVQHWNDYGYPMWLMYVTATCELIGFIGVIASFWISAALKFSASIFIVIMIAALYAHIIRAKHKPITSLRAVIVLILCIIVVSG